MSDHEMEARLRAADPASSLPPATPHEVARLLEDVMATELTTENRETGTHDRGPLTWLVAAAALVVIAGVGFFGIRALTGDDTTPLSAEPTPQTTTSLTGPADGAASAKCAVPTAELMAGLPVAFDGTVTSVDGDEVMLEPTHWYAGTPSDVVVVTAPGEQWEQLLSAVHFEEGGRYLVSAGADSAVTVCGFSAPYSDELAAVYAKAFPG
jgi:hypothetical protein